MGRILSDFIALQQGEKENFYFYISDSSLLLHDDITWMDCTYTQGKTWN